MFSVHEVPACINKLYGYCYTVIVLFYFYLWCSFHRMHQSFKRLAILHFPPQILLFNSCLFCLSVSVLQVLMFPKACWPLAPGIIWPSHLLCELTLCSSSSSSSSFHLPSSSIAISLFSDPFAALMSEFFDTDLTEQYELISISSVSKLLIVFCFKNVNCIGEVSVKCHTEVL